MKTPIPGIIWALGTVLMLPFFSGCATITRGSTEAFVIESDPAGADVALSNGLSCRTPCSLTVKRKDAFIVKITRDGYESVEATVTSQTAGGGAAAMAGNVLLGGLIGAAVDVGTGATQELKPNPLRVTLAKDQDIAPAAAPVQPAWILAEPPPVGGEPSASAQGERVASPIVPKAYSEPARAEEERWPTGAISPQRVSEPAIIPSEPGVTGTGLREFDARAGSDRSVAPPRVAEAADLCATHRDRPTTYAQCLLLAGPQRYEFIPEIGRRAGLEIQVRCHPLRFSLDSYAYCLEHMQFN